MRVFACFVVPTVFLATITTVAAQVQLNPGEGVELQHAAPAWKAILAAQSEGATKSDKRQFVFRCATIKNVAPMGVLGKEKSASQKIIAIEDQPAKLERLSQRPFVTGALEVDQKTAAGEASYQPIVTALDQGNSVEVTIKSLDENHVQLDASFSFTRIAEPKEIAVGKRNTQAVTNSTITRRVVRTVRLGEKLELPIPAVGADGASVIEYSIAEL